MDFDQMVDQHYLAMAEFTKGNPKPVTACFSQRDEVTLAGDMGGTGGRGASEKLLKLLQLNSRKGGLASKPYRSM